MIKKINRFERKWILKNGDYLKLINSLLRSNFFFKPQYPKRNVNSIYFDNLKLKSIRENLDGVSNKKKIRLRWYGNQKTLFNPVLEIKSKRGYETKKESFKLNKLNKISFLEPKSLEKILEEINKFIKPKNKLYPILTTHYERQYFISNQNKVRATVDYNLESIYLKNLSELQIKKNFFPECILELKYSTTIDRLLRHKLNEMTLRLSKNSKFVQSFFKRPKYYI